MLSLTLVICGLMVFSEAIGAAHTRDSHLLSVLVGMHQSETFKLLPETEKVFLVELLAAAEADQVTEYINMVTFERVLILIDHVTRLNPHEAKLFEEYLFRELMQESSSISSTASSSVV